VCVCVVYVLHISQGNIYLMLVVVKH